MSTKPEKTDKISTKFEITEKFDENEKNESYENFDQNNKSDKFFKNEKNDKKAINIINFYGSHQPSNSYISVKSEEDSYNNYDSFLKNYNSKPNPKSRYNSSEDQETQYKKPFETLPNYQKNLENSTNFRENQKQFETMPNNQISQNFSKNFENSQTFQKNFETFPNFKDFKANGSIIFEENDEYTKKTMIHENTKTVASEEKINPLEEEFLKKNHVEKIIFDDQNNNNNEEFVTFNKTTNKQLINQFLELQEGPSILLDENSKLTDKIKKLETELTTVVLELKQVKMEWALTEERKEETEVQLKNEIKFLLNKLINAQNVKKNDDHSRNLSLNISGIKDTLKDSIISRTSRSRSPSIYKPPSSGVKMNRGYFTQRPNENSCKTEEFEDKCEDNAKKCQNNSFCMTKTMKDLNKGN